MEINSYVVIGPKKTGSTSFFESICDSYSGPLKILPKESNYLLKHKIAKMSSIYRSGVIEVCPEYFSSYRAIIRLKKIIQDNDLRVKIIILERDHLRRFKSHVAYMFNQGIISEELMEDELEVICHQAQHEHFRNLWERSFDTIYLDMSDEKSLSNFLMKEFGVEYKKVSAANVGGIKASPVKKHLFRPIANMLRRLGCHGWVVQFGNIPFISRWSSGNVGEQEKYKVIRILQSIELVLNGKHK